jgi:hypothetical protein
MICTDIPVAYSVAYIHMLMLIFMIVFKFIYNIYVYVLQGNTTIPTATAITTPTPTPTLRSVVVLERAYYRVTQGRDKLLIVFVRLRNTSRWV